MKRPLTASEKVQRRHASVLAATLGSQVTICCASELEARHLATDVAIDLSSTDLVECCDRDAMYWGLQGGGSLSMHYPHAPHAHFRLPAGAA